MSAPLSPASLTSPHDPLPEFRHKIELDPSFQSSELIGKNSSEKREILDRAWRGVHLDEFFSACVSEGGSDVHLCAWKRPQMRVNGVLAPLSGLPEIDDFTMFRLVKDVLTDKQILQFETQLELDCAYDLPAHGVRFRINLMRSSGGVSLTARLVSATIPTLESLNLPKPLLDIALKTRRGLILVTGVTGSGKSSTLAAMIRAINETRADNIITIEDPIEYLHQDIKSKIVQREVGGDTQSFSAALRSALRADPDVLLVGEMRDLETISLAISAAETGHLVFATLHTRTASSSIERMIDTFPSIQQAQIRVQLSQNLQSVICQQLLITADGKKRVPAVEIMTCDAAIRNLIREGKPQQIHNQILTSKHAKMQTMDQHLVELYAAGTISLETARLFAVNSIEIDKMIETDSLASIRFRSRG